MGFLIPAALGALGGLFGGKKENQEQKQNYEMMRLQRSDQQGALRRKQLILAKLFKQYNFDPTEWGFGNPLAPGGFAQPMAEGAVDPYQMAEMPEFRGTPWWQNMAGGALGGIANYFSTPTERPRPTTPSVPPTMGGMGGITQGGYEFSPMPEDAGFRPRPRTRP